MKRNGETSDEQSVFAFGAHVFNKFVPGVSAELDIVDELNIDILACLVGGFMGENQDTLKLKTDTLVHTMESMTIEMSATLSSKPKTLYIYQSLLTDIYPDQTNLVIFKSGKRETGIKFDVGKHEERLELE